MGHLVNRCLMTQKVICDKIAVSDNREIWSIFVHIHHWVWKSPHPAHAYCGRCPIHYQICTEENHHGNHALNSDEMTSTLQSLEKLIRNTQPLSIDSDKITDRTVLPLILTKPSKRYLSSGEIHEVSRKES